MLLYSGSLRSLTGLHDNTTTLSGRTSITSICLKSCHLDDPHLQQARNFEYVQGTIIGGSTPDYKYEEKPRRRQISSFPLVLEAWNAQSMAGLLSFSLLLMFASFASAGFSDEIEVTWSGDHVEAGGDGMEISLKLDSSSGAGFKSKEKFLFGSISMDIKLVRGESAGTVTSFYLQTEDSANTAPNYYEYDFEFLGNVSGEPYIAQTNVYAGGKGGREQRIYLWFDPTADFHTYSLVWSKRHTIFLVDSTPVRIFKNNEAHGVPYPTNDPMAMHSSLWNGEEWATRGGLVKTDWKHAPFVASFRNFEAKACVWKDGDSKCAPSSAAPVEDEKIQTADKFEYDKLAWVRDNYLVYDYCVDQTRYPSPPAECLL